MSVSELVLDQLLPDLPSSVRNITESIDGDKESREELARYCQHLCELSLDEVRQGQRVLSRSSVSLAAQADTPGGESENKEWAQLVKSESEINEELRQLSRQSSGTLLKAYQTYNHVETIFNSQLIPLSQSLAADVADIQSEDHSALRNTETSRRRDKSHVREVLPSTVLANLNKVSDILDLPVLAEARLSLGRYNEVLDISSHVKRLKIRYSSIRLISSINDQVDGILVKMASNLIAVLRSDIKLSMMIKTVSFLKRIHVFSTENSNEKSSSEPDIALLKRVFINCRFQFISTQLAFLSRYKELDQHVKYLKRFIEVIREYMFGTVVAYKTIFPMEASPLELPKKPETPQGTEWDILACIAETSVHSTGSADSIGQTDPLIRSFIDMVLQELIIAFRTTLHKIESEEEVDSVLLQLVYCCQSLARIGADFDYLMLQPEIGIDPRKWQRLITKQRNLVRNIG